MASPTVFRNLYAGQITSSTALATVFTHSSGLLNPDGVAGYGGIIDRILFYNPDTIAHSILAFRVGSGLSAGSTNLIESVSLPSLGAPYILEGPFFSADKDFLQVRLGETASSQGVSAQAWYHEMR